MLSIPWSLLLIWFMIRLMLEKNTPVGKSECKTFIKKLKTHNSIKFRMHYIYRERFKFYRKVTPCL